MKLDFAITPCPNDVFSYYSLLENEIENNFNFVFSDIEDLNKSALIEKYPITKLSFSAYLNLRDKYSLLNVGAALGKGTGPVFVSKKKSINFEEEEIAIPGINTTANLLLNFYAKRKIGKSAKLNLKAMHFRNILDSLENSICDSAVLIHEGRFVYEKSGLNLICDLGKFWEDETNLPVPLGCICIRNDFLEFKSEVEEKILNSIKFAFENPEKTYPLVAQKAQYLEGDILQKHIYAFVNEYSLDISSIKKSLIKNLENCL